MPKLAAPPFQLTQEFVIPRHPIPGPTAHYYAMLAKPQFDYLDACYLSSTTSEAHPQQVGDTAGWGYSWSNFACEYQLGQTPALPPGVAYAAVDYNNGGVGNFDSYGISGL